MLTKTDKTARKLARSGVVERTRHEQSEALKGHIAADEASVPDTGRIAKAGESDLHELNAQFGEALMEQEVIRRFKSLNPAIHFEVANADPTILGVYILHPQPIRENGERREFICRMERGLVPEYQVFKPKFRQIPDPEIKGHVRQVPTVDDMLWGYRTVGARLIRRRSITEEQMAQAFGPERGDNPRWANAIRH